MKCQTCFRITGIACLLVLFLAGAARAEATATQTFTLQPGWNAIFLEVQPEPKEPVTVFRDLPVESVWTWFGRSSSVQFIQNPSEGLWGQPGWGTYFKSVSESFLTNLYAIFANRPYLVKLGGSQPVTWTVTGLPVAETKTWAANSFNLVGFHVNPQAQPTFAALLSPSPAHAGQPVFRLNQQGTWEQVTNPAATTVRSGEAYWVYCKGVSSYQGPLSVEIPGSILDYGTSLVQHTIAISNTSSLARKVKLRLLSGGSWLSYRTFNASSGYFEWKALAEMPLLQLAGGQKANIWLAVLREALPLGVTQGILEVSDDGGSLFLIRVSVEKVGS